LQIGTKWNIKLKIECFYLVLMLYKIELDFEVVE